MPVSNSLFNGFAVATSNTINSLFNEISSFDLSALYSNAKICVAVIIIDICGHEKTLDNLLGPLSLSHCRT